MTDLLVLFALGFAGFWCFTFGRWFERGATTVDYCLTDGLAQIERDEAVMATADEAANELGPDEHWRLP